ncbi:MAG: DUF4292 domain-containing protein [Mucilaginibacter sp.]
MRRNILNKLLIAVCLLVMVSCKARKKLVVAPPAPVPAPVVKTVNPIDDIKARQLNFNTFAAKSSTTLNIDDNSNDVTLNIRIDHNKKIWVSVTAILGIEVARALITPDSIYVINKLQGMYLKKPFSYIYTYASKQINYKTLEALLVGNAMPEILNDPHVILQPTNGNVTLSGKLQELVYRLTLGPDKKAQLLNLSNPAEAQTLQVTNDAPVQAENKIVPSQIDIQSAIKNKKIQVNLHYTRVDFDQQLEYPFNIPERYSPAD